MTRQFDVFVNPSSRSRVGAPYVMVMQSHFMDAMPTTLIGPLIRDGRSGDFTRVSVTMTFEGEALHLSLAEMAPVYRAELKRSVEEVRDHEDDIRRALDRLFTGF